MPTIPFATFLVTAYSLFILTYSLALCGLDRTGGLVRVYFLCGCYCGLVSTNTVASYSGAFFARAIPL